MTLVLKFDLDIVKIYVCTENEVLSFSGSKVVTLTNTQTDTQTNLTEIITYLHLQILKPHKIKPLLSFIYLQNNQYLDAEDPCDLEIRAKMMSLVLSNFWAGTTRILLRG